VRTVYNKCRKLTPHSKIRAQPARGQLQATPPPTFGNRKVGKLTRVELQAYFNSLSAGVSPKTIKLIHDTLRAALNQAVAWEMPSKNPAVGVPCGCKGIALPLNRGAQSWRLDEITPEDSTPLLTSIFAERWSNPVACLRIDVDNLLGFYRECSGDEAPE
jgi:hypothetical protein